MTGDLWRRLDRVLVKRLVLPLGDQPAVLAVVRCLAHVMDAVLQGDRPLHADDGDKTGCAPDGGLLRHRREADRWIVPRAVGPAGPPRLAFDRQHLID